MSKPRADQRLVAILAADVAGYSKLMEANERATLAALDACRTVFRDSAAAHGGRIVDTAGDSVLAVFPSAIGAVEAGLEVQDELETRNEALPEPRRMRFRLGINLGDVIEKDDGSIYGSGVNVAARLEGLAVPGGVMISEDVHRQVMGKLDRMFEDAGVHEVKNITKPVRVYRVIAETVTAASPSADTPVALPDKPSIAVLPFENLSGGAEPDYFADGITEDLITELSRLRWLLVTARNSSFTYKGRAVDVKKVGRDLGVRYVVEGSVRKGGDRVRINAQLIEAASGNHVWAERYDREMVDLFDLQDEITETLVSAMQAEVGKFERERAHRKAPSNLDAWESYQRGMWHLWRMNAEDLDNAHRYLQGAVRLDPKFAQPLAAMAYVRFVQVIFSYTNSPKKYIEEANQLARQAIALDDREAMGHFALGRVQTLEGDYDAAVEDLRTAIELNPSLALAHHGLGMALVLAGRPEAAIAQLNTAIRLSPRDPVIWLFHHLRAWANLELSNYEASVEDARRATRHPDAHYWANVVLVASLAYLERQEEAKKALDTLMELKPDFSPDLVLAAIAPLDPERVRPRFQSWFDGLRMAGLEISDEPPPSVN